MQINFHKAAFLSSYGLSSQLPPSDRLEIAFAGRSNVGKSSLINKLFNRKGLARVSSVPGKTATINFYEAGDLLFVDLPGYGYAKVGKNEKQRWAELIEGYFNADRNVGLIVQLIDMRHPPSADDFSMLDYLAQMQYPFVIALTKCDKLNKMERAERTQALTEELAAYPEILKIPFSAVTGEGTEELRAAIAAAVENGAGQTDQD